MEWKEVLTLKVETLVTEMETLLLHWSISLLNFWLRPVDMMVPAFASQNRERVKLPCGCHLSQRIHHQQVFMLLAGISFPKYYCCLCLCALEQTGLMMSIYTTRKRTKWILLPPSGPLKVVHSLAYCSEDFRKPLLCPPTVRTPKT